MDNFEITIDLKKLPNAFIKNIVGQTESKRCLCIPIDNTLFEGKKDTCYLNLIATSAKLNFGTHVVKRTIGKNEYNTMSDEEKKNIPILGNMKIISRFNGNNQEKNDEAPNNDLPF